eukprot:8029896-Pyramimonas_sp.AAC.1
MLQKKWSSWFSAVFGFRGLSTGHGATRNGSKMKNRLRGSRQDIRGPFGNGNEKIRAHSPAQRCPRGQSTKPGAALSVRTKMTR